MKRLSLLTLSSGLLLALTTSVSHAELKLGYVSSTAIVQKSPQTNAAQKKLEQEFSPRKSKLEAEFNAIRKQEEKLVKEAPSMTEAQRNKALQELNKHKTSFNQSQQQLETDFAKRRNEEVVKVQRTVSEIITGIGKREGYDMIFTDGVAYAKDSRDLTDRVLKELAAKK